MLISNNSNRSSRSRLSFPLIVLAEVLCPSMNQAYGQEAVIGQACIYAYLWSWRWAQSHPNYIDWVGEVILYDRLRHYCQRGV